MDRSLQDPPRSASKLRHAMAALAALAAAAGLSALHIAQGWQSAWPATVLVLAPAVGLVLATLAWRRSEPRSPLLLPTCVFVVGSALGLAVANIMADQVRATAAGQFAQQADLIEEKVQERQELVRQALKGMAGVHASMGRFEPGTYHAYWEARGYVHDFPGVRGFGVIESFPRAQLPAWERAERRLRPRFAVRTGGEAPDLHVIRLLEPVGANAPAIGLDIGSQPVRRAAAERAIITGEVTLTGVIELMQDLQRVPGFLFLLPVYDGGEVPDQVPQRRARHAGYMYAALVAREFFEPLASLGLGQVTFELHAGRAGGAQQLLFRSGDGGDAGVPAFSRRSELSLAGQPITLSVRSTPAFDASQRAGAAGAVGGAAVLVSALLAFVVWLQGAQRERAERRAQAMTSELRLMADITRRTNDAVIVTDVQGRVTWVNEAFTRITGYTAAEAVGRTPGSLLQCEQTDPATQARIARSLMAVEPVRVEILNRAKDGRLYWLDLDILPLHGEDGTHEGYMAVERDITRLREAAEQDRRHRARLDEALAAAQQARAQAEASTQQARDALARLRAVHDVLPVGLAITDGEGRVVDCNAAAERLMGLARNGRLRQAQDDPAWTILDEDGQPMPAQAYASVRALRTGAAVHSVVMQVLRPEGPVWLSVSAVPVQGAGGGVVIAFVDITAERQQQAGLVEARQAAEQASRAKGQFLANMSHEIRTPMNAVLGMLDLLQGEELAPRQRDYARKAERAGRSLLQLLNDILDFSKVEAGKLVVEHRPFRLDDLLRDLALVLAPATAGKRIELLVEASPALPAQLAGDELRLRQVLLNLCGNAIKFTEHGSVVLRLEQLDASDDAVRIAFSVRDTGIGIAAEHLHRIFEGFSQAEASTTRRYGGTGLGLAICTRLVDLMGGRLEVDSVAGQGSCFRFVLALRRIPGVDAPLVRPRERRDLLLAVPGGLLRDALAAMGAELGWAVDAVADAPALAARLAQRRAEGEPYDAVVLDAPLAADAAVQALQPSGVVPPLVLLAAPGERVPAGLEPAALLQRPVLASTLAEAVAAACGGGEPAAAGARPRHRLRGLRVLLAEDNPVNQEVAVALLSREGAVVQVAGDGAEAVRLLAEAPGGWDVVLMDVQMPVLDGYAATRRIRETLGLHRLPVVAMTANALDTDRDAAAAAGMDAHVGKPFEVDHLVQVLRALVAREALPAEAPPAAACVDRAELRLRLGGNEALVGRVLQAVARELQAWPARWQAAAQESVAAQAALVHALKGAAGTAGAPGLQALAAALERLLRAGDAASPESARLQAAVLEAVAATAAELAGGPGGSPGTAGAPAEAGDGPAVLS
jgi:PAS domain S-box-containing protein